MAFSNQYEYQHLHLRGKGLNIGCDTDASNLKAKGCTNLDLLTYNEYTKQHLPVDIVGDARNLPIGDEEYDTAVLGDILEHFVERDDVIKAIREAWRVLKPGGRLIVTVPEDLRDPAKQGYKNGGPMYAPGIRAYHFRPITREMALEWIKDAGGFHVQDTSHISYPFTSKGGWGVMAMKVPKQEATE